MNLNLDALKAGLLILCTVCLSDFTQATSPNHYPEINDELGELLVNGMGELLNDYPEGDPDYPTFSDAHYRARFIELSGAIQYRLTDDIKNHIIHRTERYRSATERTLGLSQMYFPIFEEYLAQRNIPHHLKYLPIVESNLNAVAKSHAAAVGLWQFIPGTGKLYGLKIVSYLDERSDTHKASAAAATMLSQLYKRYGDWPLALAAYNCGPGRVDKYVKGNDKNFWDIRSYLPKETQMYVPYFMAVAYSYEFHHLHDLTPKELPSDLVLTDSIHLEPGYQSLSSLSAKYKINRDTLKRLNPAFIKNYVPSSSQKTILVLPARIVAKERNYEEAFNRIMSMKTENPIKCIRRVNNEEDLALLMKAHRFTRHDFLFWNGLPSDYMIKEGDLMAVRRYLVPKDLHPKEEKRKNIKRITIASLKVVGLDDKQEKALTAPVYVSVKKKKLANKLGTSTQDGADSNMGIAASKNPYQLKNKSTAIPAQKAHKEEIITEVSENRSRDRRLRNSNADEGQTTPAPAATLPAYQKPKMLAAKAVTPTNTTTEMSEEEAYQLRLQENAKLLEEAKARAAAEEAAKKEAAQKQVTQLSQAIQSKEQAHVRAKSYTKTSAEEVSTLSTIHKETEQLKKERTKKSTDK